MNRCIPLLLLALACGETDAPGDDGSQDGATVPGDGTEPAETTTDSGTDPDLDRSCSDVDVSWDLEVAWASGWWQWEVAIARIHDGDGDGDVDLDDPISFVAQSDDGDHIVVVHDYKAIDWDVVARGEWRTATRLGDTDGLAGAEVVTTWYDNDGSSLAWVGAYGSSVSAAHSLPESGFEMPWIGDIDADGQVDVLLPGMALDLATGDVLRTFPVSNDSPTPVAIDLDLDGVVDVLNAVASDLGGSDVGLLGADGSVAEACGNTVPGWTAVAFGVADLDGDAEGEFVAASRGQLHVCDSDGRALVDQATTMQQPSLVAIGDLDGDLDAEIVLTGANWDADPYYAIEVYDHHLNLLWSVAGDSWMPLSLADLDGDGDHEILVLDDTGLSILDGDGTSLALWPLPDGIDAISWHAQPVVADVDQDGLAELVLPLSEMTVLDTPTGGFPAPGAINGWSGLDHHPGRMDADGTLHSTGGHWLTPGHNGWNAHPTCVPAVTP